MSRIFTGVFPDIPSELSSRLFHDDQLVVIGVIGKSNDAKCNKMIGFDMVKFAPENTSIQNGQISFYFNESEGKSLYIHFQTTFDMVVMEQLFMERLTKMTREQTTQEQTTQEKRSSRRRNSSIHSLHTLVRTKFAQMLLFAIQICHIIVLVEPNNVFDTGYLSIFKALKVIREQYVLKFLPKFLKNSSAGAQIGKEGRLCSPRFLFYFEKTLNEYSNLEALQRFEFEIEDSIYKMLRNEFVITNNSLNSLFSIPRNKRFVCINTNRNLHANPITKSVNELALCINKEKYAPHSDGEDNDSDDDIRPFKGFAKPLSNYKMGNSKNIWSEKKNRLIELISEHVEEALKSGFDDSVAKYKGKGHFVIPSGKSWYEMFKLLHKIFVENPDNSSFEPNDSDYKSYLENFTRIVDIDDRFYTECCEYGLERAREHYKEMLPSFYSKNYHEQKVLQSISMLKKFGRGPNLSASEKKLTDVCNEFWLNGRQQCEVLSLRGNPCAMAKHEDDGHISTEVIISTCNCGRTQGRRNDPFRLRQANYEFYQIMMNSCTMCPKLETIPFAVFEPSSNDYRAAELEKTIVDEKTMVEEDDDEYQVLTMPSQLANPLSIGSGLTFTDDENNDSNNPISNNQSTENISSDHEVILEPSDDEINEIVIQVGGEENEENLEKGIYRQPSTTEYLSGMVHTMSPIGLLPQFSSWSLVCVGHSSVYSHNSGIPEHAQSGFLSGANFLLPWDVQVRLENAASWARTLDKARHRRKPQPKDDSDGQVFMLKIFVGCEYECARGHRFFMSSPDTILRGGSGIVKDGGSKIVFNDMPLYFACPCRNAKPSVAQLMRVHVVTPKAPVNIILEPKIRTGDKNGYTFTTGLTDPPKLSQSAYWVLRLPYVYEGNDGPIMPPADVTAANCMNWGYLSAGMYGIVETKTK
ncbi:protein SMG8 [Contarinia nasturtii]|uniref:protein SMG8 n=1 Tax=Contarinia nasturtii TaxID=265458 RepID=UPI0012D40560|nr:protein SMG8 [Contarinia nasturtii]